MIPIPSVDHEMNSLQQNTTEFDDSESDNLESTEMDNVDFFEHAFLITDPGVQD